jgi:chromosome segregation ATPase
MSTPAIVTPLALLGGAVASAGTEVVTGLPPWIAAGLTVAGGFGWLRYVWLPKAEKRLRNAQATEKELGGDRISVETAEEVVKFAREEFARIKGDASETRENYRLERIRADEAHHRLIETQSALAGAQAQLSESVARSASDRSTLSRQIHALEEQLHLEERRCSKLSDELDTLRAQIGATERRAAPRRKTDQPAEAHRLRDAH